MADIERMVEHYRNMGYSERNADAGVCQDIILKAISKSGLSNNITVKGGVVMRGITGDERRATEDIDLDFIIIFYVRGYSNYNRLLNECDTTTTGVVYTQKSTGRSAFLLKDFGARFVVEDTIYYANGVSDIEPNYGETVQIHYKSSDPSVAYAGSRPERMNTFVMIIFVFCGVITAYAMIKLLVTGENL